MMKIRMHWSLQRQLLAAALLIHVATGHVGRETSRTGLHLTRHTRALLKCHSHRVWWEATSTPTDNNERWEHPSCLIGRMPPAADTVVMSCWSRPVQIPRVSDDAADTTSDTPTAVRPAKACQQLHKLNSVSCLQHVYDVNSTAAFNCCQHLLVGCGNKAQHVVDEVYPIQRRLSKHTRAQVP